MEKKRLSSKLLKEMAVGERISDTGQAFLEARCGSNGVSFYFVKKYHGEKINRVVGRFPATTIEEARAVVASLCAKIANHDDLNAICSRRWPVLRDVIESFCSEKKNSKQFFKAFALLYDHTLDKIHREQIEKIHKDMSDTPYMANRCLEYIKAAINLYCKRTGRDIYNPARGIEKYAENPRRRVLQENEAYVFLDALATLQENPIYATQASALLMMIYTGARKSNVLGMEYRQVVNGIWFIPSERSKNGLEMQIELNQFAIDLLQKQFVKNSDKEYVFPSFRGGGHLKDCRKTMAAALKNAGIIDLHIHDLRRSLGSWMISRGIPIVEVSRALGHESIKTTEKAYAHLLKGKVAAASGLAVESMFSSKKTSEK